VVELAAFYFSLHCRGTFGACGEASGKAPPAAARPTVDQGLLVLLWAVITVALSNSSEVFSTAGSLIVDQTDLPVR